MGVGIWASRSTFDNKSTDNLDSGDKLPNPNPANFRILHSEQIGDYLLLSILYPDCINYEGKKILVFKGVTLSELKKQKRIDPHFSENKLYHSPIARFEPTLTGWKMAQTFTKEMNNGE
jgi:hypothetical protein